MQVIKKTDIQAYHGRADNLRPWSAILLGNVLVGTVGAPWCGWCAFLA